MQDTPPHIDTPETPHKPIIPECRSPQRGCCPGAATRIGRASLSPAPRRKKQGTTMKVPKHAVSPDKAKTLSRRWGEAIDVRSGATAVVLRQRHIFYNKVDTKHIPLVLPTQVESTPEGAVQSRHHEKNHGLGHKSNLRCGPTGSLTVPQPDPDPRNIPNPPCPNPCPHYVGPRREEEGSEEAAVQGGGSAY